MSLSLDPVPCLPLQDTDPAARSAALDKARACYRYGFTVFPGVSLAAELPKGETAPDGWNAEMARVLVQILGDLRAADRLLRQGEDHPRLQELMEAAKGLLHLEWEAVYADVLHMLQGGIDRAPESIAEYKVFFQTIPAPDIAHSLDDSAEASGESDRIFAQQATAGGNPMMIRRVADASTLPAGLTGAAIDAMLAAVCRDPADSLARAAAEARLYLADYSALDRATTGALGPTGDNRRKYLTAPLVLYVRPAALTELRVVAIQLHPQPDSPVFTPADGVGWKIARTFVGVADAHMSAIYYHHARTHLVIEPIALATHRQLAPRHPLYRLLVPHFDGTFYINNIGQRTVFAEGGLIEDLVAATRPAWRGLAVAGLHSFDFNRSFPDVDFRDRGVDDLQGLPSYAYRDDARLVRGCIQGWVREVVERFYGADADVQADNELQAWLREILCADGGAIRGIGENGRVRTRAYLAEMITQVIFLASAQHWSMNFPLKTLMTFVPNMPFAAYAPPPQPGSTPTEAQWMATLPPLEQAQKQFVAAYLMGALRVGALGQYPDGWFTDPAICAALRRFQAALQAADAEIDQRNQGRYPYRFMKPAELPQSINI